MAEKIFNTRIKLRIDTLENWNNSTATLLPGEIAFASVAANEGLGLTEPVIMAKIATEEGKTFAELPWAFHSKASDVLAACKSESALTAFVNGVIASAGIATNDALTTLAGKVTTAEGKITTLEGEMDAVEGVASANASAITALQGLVGDTKVADQISAAIADLKIAEYAKKTEVEAVQTALDTYKTSNDAAVQKNATDIAGEIARAKAAEEANANAISAIKDGTTIDSFADVETALAGKEASGAAEQALTDAKAHADGLNTAMNTRVEALEAIDHSHANAEVLDGISAEKVAAWDAAEQNAKDYVNTEITRIAGDKTVAEAIAELDLANTYAAKSHTHTKAEITDFAHTHAMSEVNGLADEFAKYQLAGDYATKDEAQAMADGKDAAIAAAQAAADKAQEEVDALELVVGTLPEGKTSVVEYINEKTAGIATDAALGELQEAVDAIEADYLKAADKTALQDQITANDGEIAALQELVGDTAVATQISTAVKEEADRAKGIEGGLETRLKAVEDDYLKEADKTELTNAIATAKQEAIATVLGEGTDEDFDTLKEVADWILSDTTGAAALQTDVAAIKADYLNKAAKTELEGKITTAQNAADKAQGEVDALEEVVATKAAQADLTELAGRVSVVEGDLNTAETGLKARMTAAEADIDALATKVGDETVAAQIEAAIEALKIGDYAKAADLTAAVNRIAQNESDIEALEGRMDAAEGDIDALETEVDKKANDADLAAIAKTGNVNDLVQTEGDVIIFDCGTSAV